MDKDEKPDTGVKRSKWHPVFLITILLVAGLGFYAYWHRHIYPQQYQDSAIHHDVNK